MSEFPHDHIKPFSEEGGKKQQVSAMFDSIAGRYDLVNRVLSAGIDIGWRKKAIGELARYRPAHILDVATGTGDMALMAARILQPERITGIDISEGMLAIGRKKVESAGLTTRIELVSGDSETINFPDGTFDAGMVAFGVRNFEHLQQGLAEILRVLKPGAPLIVLEFSKPKSGLFRALYRFYMTVFAPNLAKWMKQNKEAYQYLNESSQAFPDRKQFTDILDRTGFSDTSFKQLSLGICCIYRGRKPDRRA
ncbi:MAG TPA: bifunctional demethylmenaquinone methyltransferase/2-methoxy-6-polyprenyl-1,4-benzoquinol methylase UbiE [Chitinophagaceae bacterium]|jgi:demethylmenaquinone methyltransferase/2-methoxy-6-polyprenyl-1,4-benzoquinol methylase|nr:bifunctional demethylmenaquinone methyltransferase/2-methoxy-6-polyprenyl-1,4-benzoquinol methylase UbiE [Chitinophagaceae bacterium]